MTQKTNNNEIFVTRLLCSAVIDNTCSKIVARKEWFDNYKKMLDDASLNKIDLFQSHTPFKFGDGQTILFEKRAIIPAKIRDTECKIDVEIVNAKIPLFLSKSSLKKANTVIDLQNDTVKMFDKSIDVKLSSNGHYAIDISPTDVLNFHEIEQVLVFENYKSNSEKNKSINENSLTVWPCIVR